MALRLNQGGARNFQPLRATVHRLVYFGLIGAAFGLMLLGKADTVVVEVARTTVADAVSPILDSLSRPVGAFSDAVDSVNEMAALRQENEQLRQQNKALQEWQTRARALMSENTALRNLLNLKAPAAIGQRTVRIIADPAAPFVRSLLVNAGRKQGVRKGQAAVTGDGLVGRVAEVGDRAARVLLITDLNARIPVVVERTRDRAILAGDNTDRPQLIYLSPGAEVVTGDRVVTSGHGGAFPPGIPVGVVKDLGESSVRVQPLVDWNRLEYVRLLEFGLDGIIETPSRQASAE